MMSQRSSRGPTPRSSRMTQRTDTARDKKDRLKGFLVNKLRDRNGIINEDPRTCRILDEEAARLLGKPASENELRKAEKRIMKRLNEGGGTSRAMGQETGRQSARSGASAMITGRSAISHATSVLDEVAHSGQLPNVKEDGGYDYWLRFMEMDVRTAW